MIIEKLFPKLASCMGDNPWIVRGCSTANGFKLEVQSDRNGSFVFSTRQYAQEDSSRRWVKRLTILVIIAFAFIMNFAHWPLHCKLVQQLFANIALFGLLRVLVPTFIQVLFSIDAQVQEWHACEHKIVYLLNRRIVPTVENVGDAPYMAFECGSMHACCVCSFWFWGLVGVIGYCGIFFKLSFGLAVVCFLFMGSAGMLQAYLKEVLYSKQAYTQGSSVAYFIFELLLLPTVALGYALHTLAIREPSAEKIKMSVEDVNAWIGSDPTVWPLFFHIKS